jgi:hypothetical protein
MIRDEQRISLQGKLDLAAHVVGWIVQAAHAIVLHVDPARTDHDQHGGCAGNRILDGALEILSGLDRVDVAEHLLRTEAVRQAAVQPPGRGRRIRPAIAQEDRGQREPPCGSFSLPRPLSSPRRP